MLFRTPCSVTGPVVAETSSRAAVVRGDVVPEPVDLVRPVAEDGVEDLAADRHQVRVGHPRAVEPVGGLAVLSARTFSKAMALAASSLRLGMKRGHAADRDGAAPVAGADQQLGVGAHERRGHGDLAAVRQHEPGPRSRKFLMSEKM